MYRKLPLAAEKESPACFPHVHAFPTFVLHALGQHRHVWSTDKPGRQHVPMLRVPCHVCMEAVALQTAVFAHTPACLPPACRFLIARNARVASHSCSVGACVHLALDVRNRSVALAPECPECLLQHCLLHLHAIMLAWRENGRLLGLLLLTGPHKVGMTKLGSCQVPHTQRH